MKKVERALGAYRDLTLFILSLSAKETPGRCASGLVLTKLRWAQRTEENAVESCAGERVIKRERRTRI